MDDPALVTFVAIPIVVVLAMLGVAPWLWRAMWRAGHHRAVLAAAFRAGLMSFIAATVGATSLALLLAGLAPTWFLSASQSSGRDAWQTRTQAIPTTLLLSAFALLPLWLLGYVACRRAMAAVFAYRPELLAVPEQEARQRVRRERRSPVSDVSGTRAPKHRAEAAGPGPRSRNDPVPPTDMVAHAALRQRSILRARTWDSVTLRLLVVFAVIWLVLRAVVLARGVAGGPWELPEPLMPVALVVIPVLLALAVNVDRRRSRQGTVTDDFRTQQTLSEAAPTSGADETRRLEGSVGTLICAPAAARPGTALSGLADASTALADVRRHSPSLVTATLVVDPVHRRTSVSVHHHLALAERRMPMDRDFVLSVVPRGLGRQLRSDVPVESDAFNQRFDTATSEVRLAHSVLTPSVLEAVLALPDHVGVVMDRRQVLVICLLPAHREILSVLAATARFIAATRPPADGGTDLHSRPTRSSPTGVQSSGRRTA